MPIFQCGPSFEPAFNVAWPTAKVSDLDMDSRDLTKSFPHSAFDAAFNMLVDSVISPDSTRRVSFIQNQNRIVTFFPF